MSESVPAVVSETPATTIPAEAELSATQAAVKSGSTQDYRTAKRAERLGKPLAAVPVKAAAVIAPVATVSEAAPATETPAPRVQTRDETYISTRIREGVDRGTAELRAEIDRLKQQVQSRLPAEVRREPEKPYDGTDPSDPKPTPDDFEDFQQYLDARDVWNDRRNERKQTKAADERRTVAQREERTAAQQERVNKFATQLDQAREADPTFVDKLTPEVRALRPFSALEKDEPGGPDNVVAEEIFDSLMVKQVLEHFSEHPDALARLVSMPEHVQAMPQAVRTAKHIEWIKKEFAVLESQLKVATSAGGHAAPETSAPANTLTSAPAPAPRLGSRPAAAVDPKAAAVKSGNTQAFREIRRRERAEQMAGRR